MTEENAIPIEELMQQLAEFLDGVLNQDGKREIGFVLLTSPFFGEGTASYISNVAREGAVQMMRETADDLAAKAAAKPKATVQ